MRYETGVPIGRGGSGVVLEAWDPVESRSVALKLLHRDEPEAVARMLREARTQARIDHPNVCRILEVGETGTGRPFIAMELVDGLPVTEATEGRSVEEKARLVATVADAVQAAHAEGLVHRDLKPENILVETRPDGSLHPVVVDFGLVREENATRLTATGELLGTPGYMSPEQARGEVAILDRRTDVFSLGVILWELIVGEPPFAAEGPMASLVKVLDHDPPPLRSVTPHVPIELASIVERCLEKDPERRYRSARSLADDLDLFLAGRPVNARPVGAAGRLVRRIRRHPRIAAVLAVAALLVLVAGLLAAASAYRSASRARIAQRFGREAERIEAELRHARMSPVHDLAPRRRRVAADLQDLEGEVERLPARLRGLGLFALGRGELALGRAQAARRHLSRAWESGFREPEVAYVLGLVESELYGAAIRRADLAEPEVRDRERSRARRELLEPALRHLRIAKGAELEKARFLEAQVAALEGDPAAAVLEAREAASRVPWLFEAPLLEGRLWLDQAREAIEEGRSTEAVEHLAEGKAAFSRAADLAPNSTRAHLGLCRADLRMTGLDRRQGSSSWKDRLADARGACTTALETDSEEVETRLLLAELALEEALALRLGGEDPEPAIDESMRWAEEALELEPDSPEAHALAGRILTESGRLLEARGRSPAGLIESARLHFGRALELEPDSLDGRLALAESELLLGVYRRRYHDGDPGPALLRAEAHFDVVERRTDLASVAVGRGRVLFERSELFPEADDRAFELRRRAREACALGVERNPESVSGYLCLGWIGVRDFEDAQLAGLEDAESRFEDTMENLDRATSLHPGLAEAHALRGRALVTRAEHVAERGEDPRPLLLRAIDEMERALEDNPTHRLALGRLGRAWTNLARLARESGESPLPIYEREREVYRRALEVNPRERDALMGMGGTFEQASGYRTWWADGPSDYESLEKARPFYERLAIVDPAVGHMKLAWLALRATAYAVADGADPMPAIEEAFRHQEASLASEENVDARLVSPRLAILGGRWAIGRGEDPEPLLERAEKDLARAREIGLGQHRAAWHRLRGELSIVRAEAAMARGEDPTPFLDLAEAELSDGLSVDPDNLSLLLETGRAAKIRGDWLRSLGRDPSPSYRRAREYLGPHRTAIATAADLWREIDAVADEG